jgi:hypothetical protein
MSRARLSIGLAALLATVALSGTVAASRMPAIPGLCFPLPSMNATGLVLVGRPAAERFLAVQVQADGLQSVVLVDGGRQNPLPAATCSGMLSPTGTQAWVVDSDHTFTILRIDDGVPVIEHRFDQVADRLTRGDRPRWVGPDRLWLPGDDDQWYEWRPGDGVPRATGEPVRSGGRRGGHLLDGSEFTYSRGHSSRNRVGEEQPEVLDESSGLASVRWPVGSSQPIQGEWQTLDGPGCRRVDVHPRGPVQLLRCDAELRLVHLLSGEILQTFDFAGNEAEHVGLHASRLSWSGDRVCASVAGNTSDGRAVRVVCQAVTNPPDLAESGPWTGHAGSDVTANSAPSTATEPAPSSDVPGSLDLADGEPRTIVLARDADLVLADDRQTVVGRTFDGERIDGARCDEQWCTFDYELPRLRDHKLRLVRLGEVSVEEWNAAGEGGWRALEDGRIVEFEPRAQVLLLAVPSAAVSRADSGTTNTSNRASQRLTRVRAMSKGTPPARRKRVVPMKLAATPGGTPFVDFCCQMAHITDRVDPETGDRWAYFLREEDPLELSGWLPAEPASGQTRTGYGHLGLILFDGTWSEGPNLEAARRFWRERLPEDYVYPKDPTAARKAFTGHLDGGLPLFMQWSGRCEEFTVAETSKEDEEAFRVASKKEWQEGDIKRFKGVSGSLSRVRRDAEGAITWFKFTGPEVREGEAWAPHFSWSTSATRSPRVNRTLRVVDHDAGSFVLAERSGGQRALRRGGLVEGTTVAYHPHETLSWFTSEAACQRGGRGGAPGSTSFERDDYNRLHSR